MVRDLEHIKGRHDLLGQKISNVEEHLRKQNGSIRELDTGLKAATADREDMKAELASHQLSCPVGQEVAALKDSILIIRRTDSDRDRFKYAVVFPVIKYLIIATAGAILVLIGSHFQQIF